MTREKLIEEIRQKKSFLCIGLDPDMHKIPGHLQMEPDPLFSFNKAIIDATHSFCVAYKPNSAFYEAYGLRGIESLYRTVDYIKSNYPNHFVIADAKRGDISNTSGMYAKAFFEEMDADAVTVAPYMGEDSVKPFLTYENKWVILLALTSNKGAFNFQTQLISHLDGRTIPLYEQVLKTSQQWGTSSNLMYVIGATKTQWLEDVRKIVPDHFLLIPGIGAQGGNLTEVCKYGLNKDMGLLVNSSRNILYASPNESFAFGAAKEAEKLQKEMSVYF